MQQRALTPPELWMGPSAWHSAGQPGRGVPSRRGSSAPGAAPGDSQTERCRWVQGPSTAPPQRDEAGGPSHLCGPVNKTERVCVPRVVGGPGCIGSKGIPTAALLPEHTGRGAGVGGAVGNSMAFDMPPTDMARNYVCSCSTEEIASSHAISYTHHRSTTELLRDTIMCHPPAALACLLLHYI